MVSHVLCFGFLTVTERPAKSHFTKVASPLVGWCPTRFPLGLVLQFHQTIQHQYRCDLLFTGRLFYGTHRACCFPQESFFLRDSILTNHRLRTSMHLLVRFPLPFGNQRRRSIFVCCSPVRHAEQENFGRCVEQHNTPLLDDGRSGFPFEYHSTLFIGLPLLTACDRIPAGEQSVLASLSVARLYRRVIPLADTITQAPDCLYSELDL